jgi:hypothetical protein
MTRAGFSDLVVWEDFLSVLFSFAMDTLSSLSYEVIDFAAIGRPPPGGTWGLLSAARTARAPVSRKYS